MDRAVEISVIVPVYNAARWLDSCLDSIAAQTAGGWECLLIDDGSTDTSGEICDTYSAGDSRFRVIHKPNGGVSSARNAGIEAARGEFLVFGDSDDTVEPEYLSTLLAAIGECDMAVCGINKIRPTGIEVISSRPGVVSVDSGGAGGFVELNRLSLIYGPVAKLYRASIVRDNAIRFPAGVHFGEDLVFNFAYLEHTRTISVTPRPLYNYMIRNESSLSTATQSRDWATNFGQWNIIRRFFERRGIEGSAAREFLANRLWGLAYDTAMSRKMSLRELGRAFDAKLMGWLRAFDSPSIPIPGWLRRVLLRRNIIAIWLLQRRLR
jgi:glycosyltransferase involved in cell wall biosynthesis